MPTRPCPAARRRCASAAPSFGDLELERLARVADDHVRAGGAGVLERVRERLLDDPVGGQVDPGRERPGSPSIVSSTGSPAAARLLERARRGRPDRAGARARARPPRRRIPSRRRISASAWRPVSSTESSGRARPLRLLLERARRAAPA